MSDLAHEPRMVRNGDVELCTQAFGDPADPPILLIGGAEASMDWWDEDFCERLAANGRYVVRYDSRDTGRSMTFPVGKPPYTGDDLLADALAVLDGLGIGAAHVVGLSSGGGLGQLLGVLHPDRVRTLALLSTSSGGPGGPHNDLPPMSEELARSFEQPDPDPDWSDRESVIAHYLAGEHRFAGAIPVDESRVRRIAGRSFDRSHDPAAAANHWQIEGGASVEGRLGEITAPTLVMHGTHDPLFPYGHAEELARQIPGATLVALPGAGHQAPPPELWDTAIPALVAHTG
jgi:pimeloyl-ACP methyl ester carboxylesterase